MFFSVALVACGCRMVTQAHFDWHWQLEKDGRQRLLPLLASGQRLLRLDTLWYLDAALAQIGHLDTLATEVCWLDLPALKHDEVPALLDAILPGHITKRLPMPQLLREGKREDITPMPVLSLHALTRPARNGHPKAFLVYARLSFDYAGERFSSHRGEEVIRRMRGGCLVEVVRHRGPRIDSDGAA